MATDFRPPRERLEQLADRVLEALEKAGDLEVLDADSVRAVVKGTLVENLREEFELEREAFEMLRSHGQKIYEQNADFQKMLLEGKKILAKKRNFTL